MHFFVKIIWEKLGKNTRSIDPSTSWEVSYTFWSVPADSDGGRWYNILPVSLSRFSPRGLTGLARNMIKLLQNWWVPSTIPSVSIFWFLIRSLLWKWLPDLPNSQRKLSISLTSCPFFHLRRWSLSQSTFHIVEPMDGHVGLRESGQDFFQLPLNILLAPLIASSSPKLPKSSSKYLCSSPRISPEISPPLSQVTVLLFYMTLTNRLQAKGASDEKLPQNHLDRPLDNFHPRLHNFTPGCLNWLPIHADVQYLSEIVEFIWRSAAMFQVLRWLYIRSRDLQIFLFPAQKCN